MQDRLKALAYKPITVASLRNEATVFGGMVRFKNPFGGYDDGIADAAFTNAIGQFFGALT